VSDPVAFEIINVRLEAVSCDFNRELRPDKSGEIDAQVAAGIDKNRVAQGLLRAGVGHLNIPSSADAA
jgi:hypothetical protein